MTMETDYMLRLFIAAMLGGAIGLERNYRAKEAGFRTHFLVALGSALFMVVSQYGFDLYRDDVAHVSLDPSRIASQVVTGIGFLGAGTIIFQKHAVKGLTTAAGVWVTAAIGLACGSGMYALAAATTVLVLLCLEIFSLLLDRFGMRSVLVTFTTDNKANITKAMAKLRGDGLRVCSFKVEEQCHDDTAMLRVTIEVRIRRADYDDKMLSYVSEFENVSVESIE